MITSQNIVSLIAEEAKLGTIKRVHSVSGGDINEAYCIDGDERFFLKVNDATRYPGMFKKEASGLQMLAGLKNCIIPDVIACGEVENQQYIILNWLEQGRPKSNFWELFGYALAELHQRSQTSFGFQEDNYIGSLMQYNNKKSNWGEFYGENRILFLLNKLFDAGYVEKSILKSAEHLCSQLNEIFTTEKPALLHGDLWSGNFMVTDNGLPAIYDPAVYYGHREMDLGMTKLFGGFDKQFYDSYNEAFPLEKNWTKRLELTQLYPLLVHSILFGGGYVQQVVSIFRRFR